VTDGSSPRGPTRQSEVSVAPGPSGFSVLVFCVACKTERSVRSRNEYSAFDDDHRSRCRTGVVLYRASLDDLLDLPPG
jgi:hypothetical protein